MGWHPVALPLLGLGLLAAGCRRIGSGQRGGNFSTQNETLAAGLETAGGVIAKKLVEYGGFCYFETIQQGERLKEGIKD